VRPSSPRRRTFGCVVAAGHLANAVNIDVNAATFATDVAELDASLPYFVYCHSGNRSAKATAYMHAHGFATLYELRDGITSWQAANKAVVTG
jgi:rhodanese-related sulfurtransferase